MKMSNDNTVQNTNQKNDREPLYYRFRLYMEHNTKIYGKLQTKKHEIRNKKFFDDKRANIRPLLKKKNIILLSNDCVGGMVLKDFGMPSYSPMVNVSFNAEDFLKVCENLDDYFSTSLDEVTDTGYEYPVCKCKDVTVYCVHAKNFDEAKKNWDIGCKNYRTAKKFDHEICVIMSERFHFNDSLIGRFESLPFNYKILFTRKKHDDRKDVFYISGEEEKKELSALTNYENFLSLHRRYERYDFYNWFMEIFNA